MICLDRATVGEAIRLIGPTCMYTETPGRISSGGARVVNECHMFLHVHHHTSVLGSNSSSRGWRRLYIVSGGLIPRSVVYRYSSTRGTCIALSMPGRPYNKYIRRVHSSFVYIPPRTRNRPVDHGGRS